TVLLGRSLKNYSGARAGLPVGLATWLLGGVTALIFVGASAGKGSVAPSGDPLEAYGLIAEVRNLASDPPVGSILPWFGSEESLPPNWQVCDGAEVRDPRSPLRNLLKEGRVPNLEGRFLRGATKTKAAGDFGGA